MSQIWVIQTPINPNVGKNRWLKKRHHNTYIQGLLSCSTRISFPDGHLVGAVLIKNKMSVGNHNKLCDSLTKLWLQGYNESLVKSKEIICYIIEDYIIFKQPIKHKGNQGLKYLTGDVKNDVLKELEVNDIWKNRTPFTMKYIVIDKCWVELIFNGSKKCEYRTFVQSTIPTQTHVETNLKSKYKKEYLQLLQKHYKKDIMEHNNKEKNNKKRKSHDMDNNSNDTNNNKFNYHKIKPRKTSIHDSLRNKAKKMDNNKEKYINLNEPLRNEFNAEQIIKESTWIITKSNSEKDKNESINKGNEFFRKKINNILKRLKKLRRLITNNKHLIIITNIIDIILTKPQKIDDLLSILVTQREYQECIGHVAFVLGFIDHRNIKCPECQSSCGYGYNKNRKHHYYCKKENGKCKKQGWSIWFNSSIKHHYKTFPLYDMLQFFYHLSGNEYQKNVSIKMAKLESQVSLLKQHFGETIKIFESHNRIVVGGEKIKTSTDHKHCGGKRKYNKGKIKKKSLLIQSSVDDRGLRVTDIASNEQKEQVKYLLEIQNAPKSAIATDQHKSFIQIPKIEDKEYQHGTVNHSGTKHPTKGYVCHFKNPITGIHTNPVEHHFGKVGQQISHKGFMMRNENIFERRIKEYDFRINRSCNFQVQVFMQFILLLPYVYPPNKESLKEIKLKKFENVYEVDFIFDKHGDNYRIKWKSLGWNHSQWINESDFHQKYCDCDKDKPKCPTVYNQLQLKEKENIKKKALKSIETYVIQK